MDGDYNLRGYDLATYYSQFTRRAMPPAALRALSYADALCKDTYGGWHIGYACWMALVCAPRDALAQIDAWAQGQARALAETKMPGKRRKRFCESYREDWGSVAALDGVSIALYGKASAPSLAQRAEQFGISRAPFGSIRRLIAVMVAVQAMQFETELRLAIDLKVTGHLNVMV